MNTDEKDDELDATDDLMDQTMDLSSNAVRAPTDANGLTESPSSRKSGSGGSQGGSSGGQRAEVVGNWIGPYKLLQEIGSGGMGAVFMAEQREPVSRRVALKIIKAGMDSEQIIARFEVERQALSMMEHPNIARVLDAGTTESGLPFFVMELVRGSTITKFCDQRKLNITQRLKLFCEVCDAIQHAHQKGIIHRDLKPSNILVTMHNDNGVPKVIDFGVAKATSKQLTEKTMFTQLGEVVGTLEYMSPEQAQMTDLNVDTRSDIYSLGVLLYELLTGSTPLKRQKVRELGYLQILSRISEEEAPKPSARLTETVDKRNAIAEARGVDAKKLSSALRGDLDWIVLKSLEKDRTRRYESANGFADDIRRFLNAEPITARPPTSMYLLRKFVLRHRAGVAAAVAVLLTLVAGVALASWQAYRATRAETQVAIQLKELQRTSDVEKKNAELNRKIERENEIQIATLTAQIRSTINHGEWTKGLTQIAAFQAEFGELPIEILMLRLSALDGLSKLDQLKTEIMAVEQHADADKFRSQLQLWRGYTFLSSGSNGENGKELIQTSIEGLELDDRLFAEGLVSDSLVDAVNKYNSALQQSPFHAKARMQLIVTLIMLGRYEDAQRQINIAKTLFSNDRRLYFADVVCHALANETAATNEALKELRTTFPNASVRDLQSLIGFARSMNNQFKEYDRSGLFDWFSIIPSGIPLFQHESRMQLIPVPEFQKQQVFDAYGEFAKSFLNPLLPVMSETNKHESMVKTCQKAYQIHPDSMFKCFEGWSHFSLNDYEASSRAFDEAIISDGLFPDIRNQGLYGAFATRMAQYQANNESKSLLEAMTYLEEYVAASEFDKHRGEAMFLACCQAGRWPMAREIIDELIDQGELADRWLEKLVDQAIRQENYGVALSACDEILKNDSKPSIRAKRNRVVELITALEN